MLSAVRASPPDAPRDQRDDVVGRARRRARPRRAGRRSPSSSGGSGSSSYTCVREMQRRVDLEVRVLRRRADQRHEPRLDVGQQRVLLRLVEAVDLVEEEDRAPAARAEPLPRPREHLAHVLHRRRDRRQLLERGAGRARRRSARASSCRCRAGRRRSSERTRSSSIARRSAEPSPRTCSWPTNSSRVRGRSRCASGATSPARRSAASEKRSPMTRKYAPPRVRCCRRQPGAARATSASPRPSVRFTIASSQRSRSTPGERVLDVACGTGGVALRAARAGADVVGIDISAAPAREGASPPTRRTAGLDDSLRRGRLRAACRTATPSSTVLASAFGADLRRATTSAPRPSCACLPPGGPARLHRVAEATEWSESCSARGGDGRSHRVRTRATGREEAHVRAAARRRIRPRSSTTAAWRIEADSGEELWELASTSMPPLRSWLAEQSDEVRAHAERVYLEYLALGVLRSRVRSRRGDAPMSTPDALRDEVTDLLQRLIRVDTTNPPGNETAAAELLREYLEANGVECELHREGRPSAPTSSRGIPGGDGPSLLFLCHTDVVLADPADWSVPPFSGELRDGDGLGPRRARHEEPGRGERRRDRVARARGVRAERRPDLRGDRRRGGAATASGSSGSCEEHPDAVRCDYAINEGGGDRLELADGTPVYLATVAEKMTAPFRAPRPRPLRARVDAADRRQRARQRGEADRADRRVPAGAAARARGRRRSSRAVLGEVPPAARGGRARAAMLADRRRARRRAARADLLADDDLRLAEAERHPRDLRDRGRLPAAARASTRSTSSR